MQDQHPASGNFGSQTAPNLAPWFSRSKQLEPPDWRANNRPGALRGLRVVEWSQGFRGALCARLLGDLGADVIKIEPPGGDWAREAGLYTALNYNKRGVTVDASDAAELKFALRLCGAADIVVESHQPGYLDGLSVGFSALAQLHPGIIVASLTPFGQTGPHRDWLGEDLIGCHAGGLGVLVPDWVDDPAKPPLRPAPRQAEVQAAFSGVIAILGAVLGRETGQIGSEDGVHIDVSTQECVASILHTSVPEYIALGRVRNRFSPTVIFSSFTPARDGLIRITAVTEQHWQKLGELIGAPDLIAAKDRRDRMNRREEIEAQAARWASSYTKQELFHFGQGLRMPFAAVNRPSDVIVEPQIVARGAFVQIEQPGEGTLTLPGAPFRSEVTPWRVYRSAPALGEHNREVRAALAGTFPATVRAPKPHDSPTAGDRGGGAKPYLPLSGVRVADFSWAWAGPHCAIQLADMGADVIKVESRNRMDTSRTVGPYRPDEPMDPNKSLRYTNFNRGKAGITLNLRDAAAVSMAHRLIAVCDVVIENFAPGVMERLGLGYEALSRIRPDLVMISLSGFGNSGPERDYVAYGYTIEAYAGLAEMTGFTHGPPQALGLPYADPAGGLVGAAAILAALRHRALTGEGQHIDLSEAETLLTCLTEGYAILAGTGQDPPRLGNADAHWSPHNVYPCRDGRWLAIAVTTEAQWRSLVRFLGSPAWTAGERFATMAGRVAGRAEIDAAIAAWSAGQDAAETAGRLQEAGVPATLSQHAGDLMHDPHLIARNFFQPIDHPSMGYRPVISAPFRFGTDPQPVRRAAPNIAEDNIPVLQRLLGTTEAAYAALEAQGALT